MHARRSLALMAVSLFAACVPAFVGAAEKVGQAARSAEKIDPTGTWTWSRLLEGQEAQSAVTLSYKDGKLTGVYKRAGHVVPITNARFENNEVSFDADGKWNEQTVHGKFHGKLSHGRRGDEINGNIEIVIEEGSLPLAWIAHRGVDLGDLVGTWKLRLPIPHGATLEPHLTLTVDEGNLKGKYSSRLGDREAHDLSLRGCELSWTVEYEGDGQMHKNSYRGRLDACAAKGSIKGTALLDTAGKATSLDFTGERYTPKQEARKPTDRDGKPTEGKSSGVAPAQRQVIVMLKARHAILTVYSGMRKGEGPVFSIRSEAGEQVAREISLNDLQAAYPQFYEVYHTSLANLWAGSSERPPESNITPTRKTASGLVLRSE